MDFIKFLTPWMIGLIVIVMFTGINSNSLNQLLDGIEINYEQTITLMVHGLIFLFLMSILIIPAVKNNLNTLINKIFKYPVTIIDRFLK